MAASWIESLLGPGAYAIRMAPVSPVAFALLPIPLFVLRRRGKSAGYCLCFALFFLYPWAVLAFTIVDLPVASDLVDGIRSRSWSKEIALVPGIFTGRLDPTSLQVRGNFLLGIPFGLGIPFLVRARPRRLVLFGLGFAAGIELAQLLVGLLVYQGPYRVIDVDDVSLVFAGTLAGHLALRLAAGAYRRIGWDGGARFAVWDHIHVVLLALASGAPPPPATLTASPPGQDAPRGA